MIPALAENFYVLAPDMLGFGGTDKAVFLDRSSHAYRTAHLTSFLDTVGVEGPVDVVGNSFGGALALRALVGPERMNIKSVVSISGSGGPWRTQTAIDELGRWDGTISDLARVVNLLIDDGDAYDAHLAERMDWASAPGHVRAIRAPSLPLPDSLRPRIQRILGLPSWRARRILSCSCAAFVICCWSPNGPTTSAQSFPDHHRFLDGCRQPLALNSDWN
jgi:pimeloyl-ACP methyl ester carboxylesterase